MRTATCTLESLSPYSQSRPILTPRGEKETAKDHEERCWMERVHTDADGRPYIPPMAFKWSIGAAAKYLSISIPGEGKSKYTKHFLSGILVPEKIYLPTDMGHWWGLMNSNGQRGGGKRVWRCFPEWSKWEGILTVCVLDAKIPQEIFVRVLKEAGNFIGIGRFRPQNGGFYGRFKVVKVKWEES